ncbi:uncharacterized protein B0H18DRAFT_998091 [Fomitopsis serialis]|uniref:uncharacterized protein n=1 Tax=Fomitopsis serialis TaxID=139415 RepID=UPI002007F646|nr:uncharacterized protein B0H18DRAFT_998091 [Neoantrodia serialis]KAH9929202.1 hypothetical protein B0H18DRAFT_998091 [Neoantrodia serialis]
MKLFATLRLAHALAPQALTHTAGSNELQRHGTCAYHPLGKPWSKPWHSRLCTCCDEGCGRRSGSSRSLKPACGRRTHTTYQGPFAAAPYRTSAIPWDMMMHIGEGRGRPTAGASVIRCILRPSET